MLDNGKLFVVQIVARGVEVPACRQAGSSFCYDFYRNKKAGTQGPTPGKIAGFR
jgi:hypothetical protein